MGDRVKGKIAIVTGAAKGLGRAISECLAREGAVVVLTDIDRKEGEAAAAAIRERGGRAEFRELDVTREDAWRTLVDDVMASHGRLDILVNNAGIALLKSISDLSLEEFQHINRVNAWGTFLGCKYGVAAMRKSGGTGSIINMSSVLGQVGGADATAYSASKGAVRLMSKALALEIGIAREFIRVNTVHPGLIRTPMTEGMFGTEVWDHEGDPLYAPILLGRAGSPEDVAEAVLHLASDEAEFMSGAELNVDGGWTAI
ncbi:MAG TPA: glucose 1-dehydrogenase [Sphingomonadales bacterium]